MQLGSRWHAAAVSAAVLLSLTGRAPGVRAQTPVEAAAKLSGTWHLNKAQSTKPESISNVLPGQQSMSTMLSAQAHEVVRVMVLSPQDLSILATATDVTIAGDGQASEKYTLNNRTENVSFGQTTGKAKTKWDKAQIKQEVDLDSIIVQRSWNPSADGKHLTVTTTIDHGPGDADFRPVKFVYDK